MLLEFKAENYRSFKEELKFSMIPDNAKKELNYSILEEKINRKIYKGLCSSVIYGPNAAGKSNIIGAMDTLKKIVIRGNIKDDHSKENANNIASGNLNIIPNNTLKEAKPVKFSIKFTAQNLLFDYHLEIDLGLFLEEANKRKILNEALYVNNALFFNRDAKITFGENSVLKKYANKTFLQNLSVSQMLAQDTLKEDELFLMNGVRTTFAPKLAHIISEWFKQNLEVIYSSFEFYTYLPEINKENKKLHSYLNMCAKNIGVSSNALYYMKHPKKQEPQLYSCFKDKDIAVLAEAVESYGTIRLLNLLLPLLDTLSNGSTLVVDEFDCSLHPMVVMSIINIFHNPDINKNNAQLIFNTHNPIFLNKDLFRRDEIKFVERINDKFSELYTLADFPTSGKGSVRNSTDYMKNYFINRYGAIKDIDLSELFEKALNDPKLELKKMEGTNW